MNAMQLIFFVSDVHGSVSYVCGYAEDRRRTILDIYYYILRLSINVDNPNATMNREIRGIHRHIVFFSYLNSVAIGTITDYKR